MPSPALNRRLFLAQSAALVSMAGPRAAFAKANMDERLVVILLRGALDGLNAVPPYADPNYKRLRQEIAIAPPGASGGALDLNGFFGLHPSLKTLHRLYADGSALIVHAVASPYRDRSHFDGQDVLENGAASPYAVRSGWLNRALPSLPGAKALAVGQDVPLVLQGDAPASSWAPSRLPEANEDTIARLMRLYEDDALLGPALAQAIETDEMVGDMAMKGGRGGSMASQATAAAKLLTGPDSARIGVLEFGGWDTHANQGGATGQLANRLTQLDNALAALETGLAPVWDKTAVLVITEFGRTAAVNGNRGTDHGTGAAAFLAGGAVKGGRVIADWPGLRTSDLYEARDLKPTADLRRLLKGVLSDHLNVPQTPLSADVFPDSSAIKPMGGLIA